MSEALVVRGERSRTDAVERIPRRLQALVNRSDMIMAVLPNLRGLQILPGWKRSPNIIRLSVNKSSFSPGDLIRGTVKVMISETIHAQGLAIELGGESKSTSVRANPTHGGGHIVYDSFFKLVDETLELELEEKTLQPKIYEFPFSIELPRVATRKEEDWPYDENTLRFNSNLVQPLPGSFRGSSNETAHARCRIKYYLTATLTLKDERTIKHRTPINVLITDTRGLTAGEGFHASFMKCSFNFKLGKTAEAKANSQYPSTDRSPSTRLKDRFQETVSALTGTSYTFDLDAEIPCFGRISQPLNIKLRLSWPQHPTRSNRQEAVPVLPVCLKAVRVELQSLYMFRGTTKDPINDMSWQLVDQTLSYHVLWKSAAVVLFELKDPIPSLEPNKEINLAELMYVHPHSVLPAFKTWNISRDYRLIVLCDLECAGKCFQAKYTIDKFDVLPGEGVEDDFFESSRPSRQAQVESESEGESDDGDYTVEATAVGTNVG